jgi:hypothetical protein
VTQGVLYRIGQALADDILKSATQYIFGQGNDAFGQGNQRGCTPLSLLGRLTNTQRSALLVGVLFVVGALLAFISYYCYNRSANHAWTD